MLQLFNTESRQKEPFAPLEPGKVRMYTCGPTVYDRAHIGNFRAFLFADLLKRYLRSRGFEVFHVLNITDIDDRILRRIREEGVLLGELTGKYADLFFRDLEALNVQPADVYPRASEHIEDMLELVGRLVDRGMAYERDGSIYFSIARFSEYGRFARLDMAGMQDGARVDADEYDKENPRDFVLWKAWVERDGEVYWDSPFGRGRPGWHLECSAMSMKYLGDVFDIHTGGVDLVFPHHQNEIAQSEGVTGNPFVNYWLHNEFVNIDDEKMSKRLGNFYSLQDIGKTPEDIRAYRYLVVSTHYRTILNFTFEALGAAKNTVRRLIRLRERLTAVEGDRSEVNWADSVTRARTGFQEHLDDDLNAPRAMASVFGLVGEVEKALNQEGVGRVGARLVLDFMDEIDQVLGIFYCLEDEQLPKAELSPDLAELLKAREAARKRKDWAQSDQLRVQLAAAGVEVRDTPQGQEWTWSRRA